MWMSGHLQGDFKQLNIRMAGKLLRRRSLLVDIGWVDLQPHFLKPT